MASSLPSRGSTSGSSLLSSSEEEEEEEEYSSFPPATSAGEINVARPLLVRSQSIGVTFAPLPQVGQRKRRSRIPLGVAGRAQLVQARRATSTGYSERRTPEGAQYQSAYHGSVRGGPPGTRGDMDDLDVVIVAMGKVLKDTGRHLWRRISSHQLRKKEVGEEKGEKERKSCNEEEVLDLKKGGEVEQEVREVVFIEGENGVHVQFPQDMSQTETVGRGYSWRTVRVMTKSEEEKMMTTTTPTPRAMWSKEAPM